MKLSPGVSYPRRTTCPKCQLPFEQQSWVDECCSACSTPKTTDLGKALDLIHVTILDADSLAVRERLRKAARLIKGAL